MPEVLRRYTDLAAAIHLLKTKKITLLDPGTWDDKVDVDYMKQCSELLKRPVLALCFAQGDREQYHHWRVYAGGTGGVCIVFHKEWLENTLSLRYDDELQFGDIDYKCLSDVEQDPPDLLQLPFIKREAYRDELEYRIVRMFNAADSDVLRQDYEIDVGCIMRVVLNPWMPDPICESVRTVLASIDGCKNVDVVRSELIEIERWKQFGTSARDYYEDMKKNMPAFIREDISGEEG